MIPYRFIVRSYDDKFNNIIEIQSVVVTLNVKITPRS